MADYARSLISKIISEGDIGPAQSAGIRATWFEDPEHQRAYQWMLEYFTSYSATPTAKAFKRQFPAYRLIRVQEPYEYYVDHFRDQRERTLLVDGIINADLHLKKGDTAEAKAEISRALYRSATEVSSLTDENASGQLRERFDGYKEKRQRAGKLVGITTGFPTIDLVTGGWQPQQFILLGGLAKNAKSFILMRSAIAAQDAGKKVLFMTFEMSIDEQRCRYDGIISGVNSQHLLHGKLNVDELKRLRKGMVQRRNLPAFTISADISASTTLSGLAAKIEQHQPDVVFVDGAYLMENEVGAEPLSTQAFTAISRGLKRLAQRTKKPFVCTTQALPGKVGKDKVITAFSFGWCVDEQTEILTVEGWKTHETLLAGDLVLTLNHKTGAAEWQPVESVQIFPSQRRQMILMQSGSGAGHSSLTTPNHRWPVEFKTHHSTGGVARPALGRRWKTTEGLVDGDQLILCAPNSDLPDVPKYSDAFVELVAWFWTEGSVMNRYGNVQIFQSNVANPSNVSRIRNALLQVYGDNRPLQASGVAGWSEKQRKDRPQDTYFLLSAPAGKQLLRVAPDKVVSWDFLRELTAAQLELFIQISLLADRTNSHSLGQADRARAEAFQFACILSGRPTSLKKTKHRGFSRGPKWTVQIKKRERCTPVRSMKLDQAFEIRGVKYDGPIWCPVTPNQTWFARRKGSTYFTGNTSAWSQDADVLMGVELIDDSQMANLRVITGRNVSPKVITVLCEFEKSNFEEIESPGEEDDED